MSRIEVNSGDRYGLLTVINEVEPQRAGLKHPRNLRRMRCTCDCGREAIVLLQCLRRGETQSCGCLIGQYARPKHTHRPKGQPPLPTYQSWQSMKKRCYDPNSAGYASYGGRGITVCEKWMQFGGFAEDMGERPDGTTLDRINVDGHYEPGNCRWATAKEQQRNRRDNIMVAFDGQTMCIADWADAIGINRHTLHSRIFRYGWPVEKAMTHPGGKRNAG